MQLNELQEAWLQALESDKYNQSTGQLYNYNGYCCLGLACVVAEAFNIHVERSESGVILGGNLHSQLSVFHELQLLDHEGRAKDMYIEGRPATLVYLNDTARKSFKEIAAIIRANPEQFFKEA